MEEISWTERKTHKEVLGVIEGERTLPDNMRMRRWYIRHNDEFRSIVLEGTTEEKRGRVRLRKMYVGRINARVDSYRPLET